MLLLLPFSVMFCLIPNALHPDLRSLIMFHPNSLGSDASNENDFERGL